MVVGGSNTFLKKQQASNRKKKEEAKDTTAARPDPADPSSSSTTPPIATSPFAVTGTSSLFAPTGAGSPFQSASAPAASSSLFGTGSASGSLFGRGPAAKSPFGPGQSSGSPFDGGPSSNSPFGPGPASGSPFGGGPVSSSPFGPGPASGSPFGGAPASSSPFGPGPASGSPFGGGPASSSPFGPGPASESPFGGAPASSSPFGPGPASGSPFGGGPASSSPFGPGPASGSPSAAAPASSSSCGACPASSPSFGGGAASSSGPTSSSQTRQQSGKKPGRKLVAEKCKNIDKLDLLVRMADAAFKCHSCDASAELLQTCVSTGDTLGLAHFGLLSIEEAEATLKRVQEDLRLLTLEDDPALDRVAPGRAAPVPSRPRLPQAMPHGMAHALRMLSWHSAWAASLERAARGSKPLLFDTADKWNPGLPAPDMLSPYVRKSLEAAAVTTWLKACQTAGLLDSELATALVNSCKHLAAHCAAHQVSPRSMDDATERWEEFQMAFAKLRRREVVHEDLCNSVKWLLWNTSWHAALLTSQQQNQDDDDEDGEEEEQDDDADFGNDYPGAEEDGHKCLSLAIRNGVDCHLGDSEVNPRWRGLFIPTSMLSNADIAKANVKAASRAGFNVVRVPLATPSSGNFGADVLDTMLVALEAIRDAGMQVSLDASSWPVRSRTVKPQDALREVAKRAAEIEASRTQRGPALISSIVLPKVTWQSVAPLVEAVRDGGLRQSSCAIIIALTDDPVDSYGSYIGTLLKALSEGDKGIMMKDGHVIFEAHHKVAAECDMLWKFHHSASHSGERLDEELPLSCARFELSIGLSEAMARHPTEWFEELAARYSSSASDTTHGWFAVLEDHLVSCLRGRWSWPDPTADRVLGTHGYEHKVTLVYLHGFDCDADSYLREPEYFHWSTKTEEINTGSDLAPDEENCAVCFHPMSEPLKLTCGHAFCRQCIARLHDRQCPMCRREFPLFFNPTAAPVDQSLSEKVARAVRKAKEDADELEYGPFDHSTPYFNLKVILPNAPERPITCYNGEKFRGWYDYLTDHEGEAEDDLDRSTLEQTTRRIHAILEKEVQRVGAQRVFLGGASQGCAVALHAALTFSGRLGGVIGTQGHLLSCTKVPADWASRRIPVRIFCGNADTTMPWADWVSETYEPLRASGCDVKFFVEDGVDHGDEAEGKWVRMFLREMYERA